MTFVVTWGLWAMSSQLAGTAAQAILLLGVFAPGLLAIALTRWREGPEAMRALIHRIFCWNVDAKWYAFAILYMPAIKLAVALIHRIVEGAWPRFGTEPILLMLSALLISTWVQAGEEVGWRGYALPRMSERLGLGTASIILGIIWATWHLPLFFYFGGDTRGQSFLLYLMEVIPISVAMAWLYWKTNRSLLLVMLFHAAINNLKDIVPSAESGTRNPFSPGGSVVGWTTVVLLWICATYFLVQMSRSRASLPAS